MSALSPTTPVYLDHAATTPVRDEVRDAMAPYLAERFGNPSSTHRWGREASAALENARAEAAEALGVRPGEVRFVRGGTEGDNLAVLGTSLALAEGGRRPVLVVSAVEHHAVLHTAEAIAAAGLVELRVLPVSPEGEVDLEPLDTAPRDAPLLASCMWVNNETGIILPIERIAEVTAERGGIVHTDAVQAIGKIDARLGATPIHTLTVSGHKLYGPKGTGLLVLRTGTPIRPLLHGGGQERGLRPGTEDVAGAVGLARALRLAIDEREVEATRLTTLRTLLETELMEALGGVRVNAGAAPRAPHISNVCFEGVDGSMLLISLDLEGVAVSGASACSSGSTQGSHVIRALYGPEEGRAHVRFSLGRATTRAGIEQAVSVVTQVVERLRGGP